jgi:Zn-dependent alcohol dehydrogenase
LYAKEMTTDGTARRHLGDEDLLAMIGTGGLGMNAVQGARAAGANYVVGVDPIEFKRDSAKFFGATHTCPSAEEAIGQVRELTRESWPIASS